MYSPVFHSNLCYLFFVVSFQPTYYEFHLTKSYLALIIIYILVELGVTCYRYSWYGPNTFVSNPSPPQKKSSHNHYVPVAITLSKPICNPKHEIYYCMPSVLAVVELSQCLSISLGLFLQNILKTGVPI